MNRLPNVFIFMSRIRCMSDSEVRNDDHTISPVIGVVLMVIFTVLVTAVIGSMMLSLGEPMDGAVGMLVWYI